MNIGRLAVHIWHVAECSLLGLKLLVQASVHHLYSPCQGQGICGEGLGAAAIDIPGELVEDDDLRQPSSGVMVPGAQLRCDGPLESVPKAPSDFPVEG